VGGMGTDTVQLGQMVFGVGVLVLLGIIVDVVGVVMLYRQRRWFSPPEAVLFLEQKKLKEVYGEMARSIDGKLDAIYADMRRVLDAR